MKAVDWDKDHVDLEWKAPASDGGAKIEKYIIEKKDRFGDWVTAVEVPGTETKGTAPNLIPGEGYQFRVKAVNKAGPSKPSDETILIVAKSRRRKSIFLFVFFLTCVICAFFEDSAFFWNLSC